jgi:hypothetical protein
MGLRNKELEKNPVGKLTGFFYASITMTELA